jgi:hypothetical protein
MRETNNKYDIKTYSSSAKELDLRLKRFSYTSRYSYFVIE